MFHIQLPTEQRDLENQRTTLFFLYKNIPKVAEAQRSQFFTNLSLKTFLKCSQFLSNLSLCVLISVFLYKKDTFQVLKMSLFQLSQPVTLNLSKYHMAGSQQTHLAPCPAHMTLFESGDVLKGSLHIKKRSNLGKSPNLFQSLPPPFNLGIL